MNVLESILELFCRPICLENMQLLCGPTMEKCNIAFINVSKKLNNFIETFMGTSQNFEEIENLATNLIQLLTLSYPQVCILNGMFIQSTGVNFGNLTEDDKIAATNADFLADDLLRAMQTVNDQIRNLELSFNVVISNTTIPNNYTIKVNN